MLIILLYTLLSSPLYSLYRYLVTIVFLCKVLCFVFPLGLYNHSAYFDDRLATLRLLNLFYHFASNSIENWPMNGGSQCRCLFIILRYLRLDNVASANNRRILRPGKHDRVILYQRAWRKICRVTCGRGIITHGFDFY